MSLPNSKKEQLKNDFLDWWSRECKSGEGVTNFDTAEYWLNVLETELKEREAEIREKVEKLDPVNQEGGEYLTSYGEGASSVLREVIDFLTPSEDNKN